MNKTLTLSLSRKWFDMIASSEKTEEYREIKDFWVRRLVQIPYTYEGRDDPNMLYDDLYNNCDENGFAPDPLDFIDFNQVIFTLGYPPKSDTSKRMTFTVESITIGYGNPDWGAPTYDKVFIIKLGKKL